MWLIRVEKDTSLIEIDKSDDYNYLVDKFELEVIYMQCRGLEPYNIEKTDTSCVADFSKEGIWECSLVIASGFVGGVTKN